MDIKENDTFDLKDGSYVTLLTQEYEGEKYVFTNKYDENDEPTNDFVVFKCTETGLLRENNKVILSKLFDYFNAAANDRLVAVNVAMEDKNE